MSFWAQTYEDGPFQKHSEIYEDGLSDKTRAQDFSGLFRMSILISLCPGLFTIQVFFLFQNVHPHNFLPCSIYYIKSVP
jgi:hypothetical protein